MISLISLIRFNDKQESTMFETQTYANARGME